MYEYILHQYQRLIFIEEFQLDRNARIEDQTPDTVRWHTLCLTAVQSVSKFEVSL